MDSVSIPAICLTGGPCAGKTTALSFVRQRLEDMGFYVVIVHETATELINSGITPAVLPSLSFQRILLEHLIEKEKRWKAAAAMMMGDKKVIICDRGAADIAAYAPSHMFDLLLRQRDYTIVDVRDKPYNGVIFLRSVAVDKAELYSCANNAARLEKDPAVAKALDNKTLEAWNGCPHLSVIDNSTDMAGKSLRVLQAMCRILGIPAPLEIERKYLVKRCDIALLPRPVQAVHIQQYYLKSIDGSVERIRARGQNGGYTYYHTVKQDIRPGVRTEVERQITDSEYLELLQRADPQCGRIDKQRHCFVWRDQYFELDVFQDPQGLVLLEIELTDEHQPISFPDFLQGCLTEVTNDSSYSNYEIAKKIAVR